MCFQKACDSMESPISIPGAFELGFMWGALTTGACNDRDLYASLSDSKPRALPLSYPDNALVVSKHDSISSQRPPNQYRIKSYGGLFTFRDYCSWECTRYHSLSSSCSTEENYEDFTYRTCIMGASLLHARLDDSSFYKLYGSFSCKYSSKMGI